MSTIIWLFILSWPGGAELARLPNQHQCEALRLDLEAQGYDVSPCVPARLSVKITGE